MLDGWVDWYKVQVSVAGDVLKSESTLVISFVFSKHELRLQIYFQNCFRLIRFHTIKLKIIYL